VKMFPDYKFTDDDIKKRYVSFYGNDRAFSYGLVPFLREKLSNLSEFIREIKVGFARYFNRQHNRRGYFWGDRFKSVIVEKGETLINYLAYIDLNPLRAGLLDRPEEYRWNSIGYHIQTGNKDDFLSLDFGLREFGVLDAEERLNRYRRYVYEAGALERSEKPDAGVIDNSVLKKERENDFELKRIKRFRYRTRYFTDSGIIGTKEFVSGNYRRFKDLFMSKREKIPKPVEGLDRIYSLKRLAES
jgi:putative transposase